MSFGVRGSGCLIGRRCVAKVVSEGVGEEFDLGEGFGLAAGGGSSGRSGGVGEVGEVADCED
jgi:hypothetical protein